MWWLLRALPAVDADWLRVPTSSGPVGPDWPAAWTAALGAPLAPDPDGGLIPDLTALERDDVHPAVRTFYEHTARADLTLQVRWTFGLRWFGALWSRLVAGRWGQFDLPTGDDVHLTNEILRSGPPDPCQWWVRRYAGTARALYVSRYEVVRIPSEPAPVVRITFPVPGGAWVVVFRVHVDGDVFVLTEDGGRPGGPGLYLVPAGGGPARYVRPMREEIRVWPEGTGCQALHRMWFAGLPLLTLRYGLDPERPGSRGTA
ncbi:MAG: hypothetical protein R3F59_36110 [Myxococcota bacterium]